MLPHDFIPTAIYKGVKNGYVYQEGTLGKGYYKIFIPNNVQSAEPNKDYVYIKDGYKGPGYYIKKIFFRS